MGADVGRTWVLAHSRIPETLAANRVSVIPHDPEAYGRALYAALHHCDGQEAGWIVVEALPSGPEWEAIRDRLSRAAAAP